MKLHLTQRMVDNIRSIQFGYGGVWGSFAPTQSIYIGLDRDICIMGNDASVITAG
jgi:hypothetical protein